MLERYLSATMDSEILILSVVRLLITVACTPFSEKRRGYLSTNQSGHCKMSTTTSSDSPLTNLTGLPVCPIFPENPVQCVG